MSDFIKQTVTVSMDVECIKWLDRYAKRLKISRSALMEVCVMNAQDDWKVLESVGLKPEYLPIVKEGLKRIKSTMIDVAEGMELAES